MNRKSFLINTVSIIAILLLPKILQPKSAFKRNIISRTIFCGGKNISIEFFKKMFPEEISGEDKITYACLYDREGKFLHTIPKDKS